MTVLVTAASKHGATFEIAERLALEISACGQTAVCLRPDDVADIDGYDGVVLGSAVYAGHWLKPATELVDRLAPQLQERRVWLFSSGPVGEPDPKPDGDPVDVAEVVAATGALEHRILPGKIDRAVLGFAERAIVRALRVPDGDFRDWDAIRHFAAQIAAELGAPARARR